MEQARDVSQPARQVHRARGEALPDWIVWQALTLPKLEILETRVEPLGADTWRVRIAVQNSGYLPSYVSKRALERKITRGVVYEIELPAGASLAGGKPRVEGAQLEGRANKVSLQAFLPDPHVTADRGQCEWVVRAAKGSASGCGRATIAREAWKPPSRWLDRCRLGPSPFLTERTMATVRPAAVSGTFYPGEPASLAKDLAAFLAEAKPSLRRLRRRSSRRTPGYIYSGPIAASIYARLARSGGACDASCSRARASRSTSAARRCHR
jgi:hypothetical protein